MSAAPALTKPRQSAAAKLAAVEAELATVTHERDYALWLYVELENKIRAAILKQALQTPEFQEQLARQAMAQLNTPAG